jgi:hypothetical protein
VLALQSDYVKNQMAALNDQAKALSSEAAKVVGQGGQK